MDEAPAGPASREPGNEWLRTPLTALACATAVFLWLVNAGRSSTGSPWGHVPAERIWEGAYWGLLTSAFVHLALWHLIFNVSWLWLLGSAVERVYGPIRLLGLVLASAIVSSTAQLAASGDTGIGASGVVYALFGFMWHGRSAVPRFKEVLGEQTAPIFIVWLVACVIATRVGTAQIANAAHIGGLLFGIGCAEWGVVRGSRRNQASPIGEAG